MIPGPRGRKGRRMFVYCVIITWCTHNLYTINANCKKYMIYKLGSASSMPLLLFWARRIKNPMSSAAMQFESPQPCGSNGSNYVSHSLAIQCFVVGARSDSTSRNGFTYLINTHGRKKKKPQKKYKVTLSFSPTTNKHTHGV